MTTFFSRFYNNLDTTIKSIIATEFLNSTKGVVIFLILSFLFVVSVGTLLVLIVRGRFSDFASNWNDFAKKKKGKTDYEYLIGIIYRDESAKKLFMTTRIAYLNNRIVTYRESVNEKTNQPEGKEESGAVDVAEVEHMLGLYSCNKDKSS